MSRLWWRSAAPPGCCLSEMSRVPNPKLYSSFQLPRWGENKGVWVGGQGVHTLRSGMGTRRAKKGIPPVAPLHFSCRSKGVGRLSPARPALVEWSRGGTTPCLACSLGDALYLYTWTSPEAVLSSASPQIHSVLMAGGPVSGMAAVQGGCFAVLQEAQIRTAAAPAGPVGSASSEEPSSSAAWGEEEPGVIDLRSRVGNGPKAPPLLLHQGEEAGGWGRIHRSSLTAGRHRCSSRRPPPGPRAISTGGARGIPADAASSRERRGGGGGSALRCHSVPSLASRLLPRHRWKRDATPRGL